MLVAQDIIVNNVTNFAALRMLLTTIEQDTDIKLYNQTMGKVNF